MRREGSVSIRSGLCLAVVLWMGLTALVEPASSALGDFPPDRTLAPFFKVYAPVASPEKSSRSAPDGAKVAVRESTRRAAPGRPMVQAPVSPADGPVERFPLEGTRVKIDVAGAIAAVSIAQTYRNAGSVPIEAVYVFPASTRAAVHGMKMTIGKRVRVAKIMERGAARAGYESARSAGQGAALLEQQRPNVFEMSVANVQPGERVVVELDYTELLVPTDGTYELVFPTIVGPRYVGGNQVARPEASPGGPAGDRAFAQTRYLKPGSRPPPPLDVTVTLATGAPLARLECPTHPVTIRKPAADRAVVRLVETSRPDANRDFIVRWQLGGGEITSGLVMTPGTDDGYFMLTLQPPKRVPGKRLPREYLFVVDVSGSMNGFPLETAKTLMFDLLERLTAADRFNVMLFSGGSAVLAEAGLPVTPDNVARARAFLDESQAGSGTELLPALKRALALMSPAGAGGPRPDARWIVLVTDGYVTVETEAFDLVRESRGQANLFAFGIGTSVNRGLIEGLARAGQGEPFVVTSSGEVPAQAQRFRNMLEAPILAGIQVRVDGLRVARCDPPLSAGSSPAGRAMATGGLPDLLADRPLTILGEWHGPRAGAIHVSGRTGDGPFGVTVDVAAASRSATDEVLRQLWARRRIEALTDQAGAQPGEAIVKEITDLGLRFQLLTAYTSFLAVDEVVTAPGKKPTRVVQPLVLPEGVTEMATSATTDAGSTIPAAPEPELLLMLALAAGLLVVAAANRREEAA